MVSDREIPVICCRNCFVTRSWRKWMFVFMLWMLCSVTNCQTLENTSFKPVIKNMLNSNTSDTKPVRSLLADAVSSNVPLFNALNETHRTAVGVTMRPTHIPAGLMSLSAWSVNKTRSDTTNSTADSSPILGLPLPLSIFQERVAPKISDTQTHLHEMNNSAFSFSSKSQPNAGIYIPMEMLHRMRRQVRGQGHSTSAGRRIIMLRNLNSPRNQTRASPQQILKIIQNNPRYNITLNNSTTIPRQSMNPARDGTTVVSESKPAIQGLGDLNQIDLTLPLRGTDDQPAPAVNASPDQGSATTKHLTENIRLRQSTSGTTNPPTRPNIHTLLRSSLRSNPSRRPASTSNLASVRDTRQPIQGTPATRLTFVQPVTGRRITPSRTSSRSSSGTSRSSSRTPAASAGTSRASSSRTITRISPGTSRGSVRTSVRTPDRSSTRRRVTSTVHRLSPTSHTANTASRRSRPVVQSASRSGSLRRPVTSSRVATRRTGTARRTLPQNRRVQSVRRRTPADPFTQRFSAGFQRGSRLLHQPPIDFNSLSNNQNRRSTTRRTGRTGTITAPSFLNTLALSNSLTFPGIGPGIPQQPPGLFLGGGFPTLV